VATLALLSVARTPPATASSQQQSMVEDDQALMTNPATTFARLRVLGVQQVRVSLYWSYVAPAPNSSRPPLNFDAGNPADYPTANWTMWDAIIREAARQGITVDLDPQGTAPRWALGPGEPRGATNQVWQPSPVDYREFVHALGVRYSGNYNPTDRLVEPGAAGDLPRVSFWSVWNEPDYGPSLAPQGVLSRLTVENSPRMYRNLVAAAWTALHQTGHGSDTFLIGELAPRGKPFWGVFSGMKPLPFLRALYCVDSSYRELRGGAAAIRGCPTTAAGSQQFRAVNPGLFRATGISDHPYMRWYPPNLEAAPDPDYTTLAEIGNLERAIDRLQLIYGSTARLPVWDTEFGYLTDPPKHHDQYPWVSQATAAYYMNWAEYISWHDPRIQSFNQYLLRDPEPAVFANDWGGFASGLLNYNGSQKPTYSAWRLPLYMPVTNGRHGQPLEVWGCVRPAHYALLDTGTPQTAEIQFQPATGGSFQTVRSVTLSTTGASCYFDLPVAFPSSGSVRLTWPYPTLDAQLGNLSVSQSAYSRYVQITLR
jgi:hypothetical protein